MGLDIRLPIGLMFAVLGMLLAGFGIFSRHEIYQPSLGININLIWGMVLLLFGLIMLFMGMRRKSTNDNETAGKDCATETR